MRTRNALTIVLVIAVSALAVNVTPAMADGTWTGLGADDLWSNMLNWQLADGTTWANADPRDGGNFLLNDDTAGFDTTTSVIDVNTNTGWGLGARTGITYLNADTKLYIPTGGHLDSERFITEAGAEIYITGGTLKTDSRATGFLLEISKGTWNCARWTYSGGGTLHIIGSPPGEGTTDGPTEVTMGDFMSWSSNSTPTVQFMLTSRARGITLVTSYPCCTTRAVQSIIRISTSTPSMTFSLPASSPAASVR